MGKKLYVGNLPFGVSEDDVADAFSQAGTVESVRIIVDRDTGRSKGFCFVEMATDEDAENAISKFNGASLNGRPLTVNEARPIERRNDGFGGGGRGFGGGGDRFGGGNAGGGRRGGRY